MPLSLNIKIDWCCFCYFVRNSLVALLEALCAHTEIMYCWVAWAIFEALKVQILTCLSAPVWTRFSSQSSFGFILWWLSSLGIWQGTLVLFTGVLNTIVCVCRRGVEAGFSQLVYSWRVIPAWWLGFVEARKLCHNCYRGLMYMCCVCVYAHTHTLHVLGCEPRCRDTWWARKKSGCTQM